MKVRGSIRFDIEIEDWKSGWDKLEEIAQIIDKTKKVGKIDSMGFE